MKPKPPHSNDGRKLKLEAQNQVKVYPAPYGKPSDYYYFQPIDDGYEADNDDDDAYNYNAKHDDDNDKYANEELLVKMYSLSIFDKQQN